MSSDEDSVSNSSSSSNLFADSFGEFTPDETDEQRTVRLIKFMNDKGDLEHLVRERDDTDCDKSAEKSTESRKEGNKVYIRKKNCHLTLAIDSFTESIAFAPLRSQELTLAYANRSAMLIKARLYQDALRDIDRAMEAGYPGNLRAKLFVRQALCFRGINAKSEAKKALENARAELAKMKSTDSGRAIVDDILNDTKRLESVEKAREKWTCVKKLQQISAHSSEIVGASNAIALNYTKGNGRHLVATRNIKPGEVLFIDEPYAAILHEQRQYKNCWHCFAQSWSAIPCTECSKVTYCTEKCRDAAWVQYHVYECAIRDVLIFTEEVDQTDYFLGLKLMIRAVKETGSVEALKKEIERVDAVTNLKTAGFTDNVFDGKKIASVYAMPRSATRRDNQELRLISENAITFLVLLATRTQLLGKILSLQELMEHKDLAFLCGLMTKFIMIAMDNAIKCLDSGDPIDPWEERYMAVLPVDSLLKHSCQPNVFRCSHENRVAYYAFLTIKKGEVLSVSRVAPFWNAPKQKRQDELEDILGKKCGCIACKNGWPLIDQLPCYHEKSLSKDVRRMLDEVTSRQQSCFDMIEGGNIDSKTVDEIISNMISMIGSLCQNVPMPCQDTFILMERLQKLYTKLSNRYTLI